MTTLEGESPAPLESRLPDGASELAEAFGATAFSRPFRRYQALALKAFERERAAGSRCSYLVLPPGAGKTVLGLEVARRLGRRTLVLCPNTAVQTQWLRQWQTFLPQTVAIDSDPSLAAPVTALTYQALCSMDAEQEEVEAQARALWAQDLQAREGLPADEAKAAIERLRQAQNGRYAADLARYRRRARALVAQGGSSEELLALLHRNGRAIVERAQATGPYTLVLDECHHLLQMWGSLVRAMVEALGPDTFVVGLTATPLDLLTGREEALYRSIFGSADFAVPTPAVVREGDLAPYQELALFVPPLEPELRYIAEEQERFQAFLLRLMDADFASRSFVEWLRQRIVERQDASGAVLSWPTFERERPALALAGLRFVHTQSLDAPNGVRLGERHRQPLTADDWVALIEAFCLDVLRASADPRDAEAWQEVRRALRSLGYVLSTQGVRSHVSPVDRVLALSGSKAVAASEILRVERHVLGDELRALILCDYERAATDSLVSLRGVLDPQAGSATLLLQTLVGDSVSAGLDPVLLTARVVACSRATLGKLWPWIEREVPELVGTLEAGGSADTGGDWDEVVAIEPRHPRWRPRLYVPLLTRAFEEGVTCCLVGTRALLGEGWDAQRVNVLVDLTSAGTSVAVHQMRGRSLRLDPRLPRKVADNWDVVCVEPNHPKGANDYARFVRKHDRYYAPTHAGEIESGASHVHPALSEFGPPEPAVVESVNQAMQERAQDRVGAYMRWAIGTPYANAETETVRLRFSRTPGVPAARLLRGAQGRSGDGRIRLGVLGVVGTAAGAAVAGALGAGATAIDPLAAAAVAGVGTGAAGSTWFGMWLRGAMSQLGPSDALEDMAAAVADGLRDAGGLRPEVGANAVRVVLQDDGYYRCFLANATREESALFATSLDELLGPLASPRYLIPRAILPETPASAWGALGAGLRWTFFGQASGRVVYHAVPAYLGTNKQRVAAFERAWQRHVSRGRALYYQDPRAQGILAIQSGASPFAATSQMRTLWS